MNLFLGTFQYKKSEELHVMMEESMSWGVNCFDTAPSYRTESMLGSQVLSFIETGQYKREDFFLQDKIDAWQMEKAKGEIMPYIDGALRKLQTDYIDSLLIHWPFPDYLKETWMTFCKAKEVGKVKHIGICNVRKKHVERLVDKTGVKPDIVQIERHPLRTCKEDVDFFHDLDIIVQAYSPLCRMDERILRSQSLSNIALKYRKSVGQIILRWHVQTGVSPIFMTKNKYRIKENTQIFDFELSEDEVQEIEKLNENYKIFVESICCPGI